MKRRNSNFKSCRMSRFHVHSSFFCRCLLHLLPAQKFVCDNKKRQNKITNNILWRNLPRFTSLFIICHSVVSLPTQLELWGALYMSRRRMFVWVRSTQKVNSIQDTLRALWKVSIWCLNTSIDKKNPQFSGSYFVFPSRDEWMTETVTNTSRMLREILILRGFIAGHYCFYCKWTSSRSCRRS